MQIYTKSTLKDILFLQWSWCIAKELEYKSFMFVSKPNFEFQIWFFDTQHEFYLAITKISEYPDYGIPKLRFMVSQLTIQFITQHVNWKYHLCNLQTVKSNHDGVLLLVKLQAKTCNFTKSKTPPCVFFTNFKL